MEEKAMQKKNINKCTLLFHSDGALGSMVMGSSLSHINVTSHPVSDTPFHGITNCLFTVHSLGQSHGSDLMNDATLIPRHSIPRPNSLGKAYGLQKLAGLADDKPLWSDFRGIVRSIAILHLDPSKTFRQQSTTKVAECMNEVLCVVLLGIFYPLRLGFSPRSLRDFQEFVKSFKTIGSRRPFYRTS